jgi:4'-phosphopantetheinyl transferase
MTLPSLWLLEIPPVDPIDGERLLGPEENSRYHSIQAPLRRRQFLHSRMLLRKALSIELGQPAESFEVSALAGEAPRLLKPPSEIRISLSHSKNACACLLASSPCGVDVEDLERERDFLGLARFAFQAQELTEFVEKPDRERFMQLWTAKEARFKAGVPCSWMGYFSFKSYRVCAALPLTGLKNLVIC